MIRKIKNRIWVEALGIFDFLFLLMETFFSGATVRYDEKNVSAMAACLINLLQRRGLCKNFYTAKLTLDKKDKAGYALSYRKENDLGICLSRFCQRCIPSESERSKSEVKLYLSFYLDNRVTFITMVENSDEFNRGDGKDVFYLVKHPLNSVIKQYYHKEKGFHIKEIGSFLEYVKYFLRPVYRFSSFVARKFSPKKLSTNIHEPKPSIWVEYYHNTSFGFPFYLNAIDRNKFDIVCYLDRNDGFPLKEEVKAIEEMRLKWIDLHSGSLVQLANISVGQVWSIFRVLFCGYPGLPLWFRVFRFESEMSYLLYKAVFSCFKVKVLIQHQEMSWVQVSQMRAVEDAGGIMLGYHWSNFIFYKQDGISFPQHVYFVWGKMMYECLHKRGNLSPYVLPAGLWFGYRDEDTSVIRMKDDLRFTIAIFDSSVAYNKHQSGDTLARFYLRILNVLDENLQWGGIIKSKNWNRINDLEFLPYGKEIIAKAASLIEQKRLVFLNSKVSPVTASARADISVCYGLNSAGIISGIHGHRAIHWDLSGMLHYPMYGELVQKVVFQDLEEMAQVLIRVSDGDTEIGDFSKGKKSYSYFDDFNGRSRIGDFIQSFMEDIFVSNDWVKSLDRVAAAYIKKNNIKDSFFERDNLWEDA